MGFAFNVERYSAVIEEAKPLLLNHWQAIARNKETIPFDPDYEMYTKLDEIGALHVCTLRKDGALKGYACYCVRPHPHYKSTKWAISDIFWIEPDCRRPFVAFRLFGCVENTLRDRGVAVMHTTVKIAHPNAAKVLERLGHVQIEAGYAKVIRG